MFYPPHQKKKKKLNLCRLKGRAVKLEERLMFQIKEVDVDS